MALDMRALYYVNFAAGRAEGQDDRLYMEDIKSNENCLNQNFTILMQQLEVLEDRLAALESST